MGREDALTELIRTHMPGGTSLLNTPAATGYV